MRNKIRLCMALLAVVYCSNLTTHAQVTIGADKLPEEFSVLQLEGKYGDQAYGGLRLPQLTEEQKASLNLSANDKAIGLVIYNTTKHCIEFWDGIRWMNMSDADGRDRDCYGVTDVEGNFYPASRFGDAGCWMTQNLRVTTYSDGTSLEESVASGTDTSLKYFYYPNKDKELFNTHPEYGLLYTWAAASNGSRTDIFPKGTSGSIASSVQGICPEGWVLPSDKDWNDLEKEIATSDAYSTNDIPGWTDGWESERPVLFVGTNTNGHGRSMKSSTAVAGVPSNGESKISENGGFNAFLVGYIKDMEATAYAKGTHFWTSSEKTPEGEEESGAWLRSLITTYEIMDKSKFYKYRHFSVRCKKQEN